jgi:single-stranded-DNA-specific exonuclease
MVLQTCGGEVRGSVRGTPSYPILDALTANTELFSHFGGHQQAAGFTTRPENVAALTDRLRRRAANAITDDEAIPKLIIDAEISPHEVNWQLYDQLQALEPFGVGNPVPLFVCRRLRLLEFKCVGNNHLSLTMRRGDRQLSAIMFRRGDVAQYLRRNSEIDVVFGLELNDWNGERTLQLRVRDITFESRNSFDSPGNYLVPEPV